jgi:hypothetical protein
MAVRAQFHRFVVRRNGAEGAVTGGVDKNAKLEKLAGGFSNVGPDGGRCRACLLADAAKRTIYRWNEVGRKAGRSR